IAVIKGAIGAVTAIGGAAISHGAGAGAAGMSGAAAGLGDVMSGPAGAVAKATPQGAIATVAGGAAEKVGGFLEQNKDPIGQGMMAVGAGIAASAAKDMIDIDQANRADASGNRDSDNITSRMKKEASQLSDSYIVLPGTAINCTSSNTTTDSSSRDKVEGEGGFMNLFSQHAGNSDSRKQKSTRESISEKYFALIGESKRDACMIGTFIADGWGQALERANMTDLFFKLKPQADVKAHKNLAGDSELPVIQNINEIKYGKSPKKAIEQEFEKMIRANWAKLFPNQ
ncbi:MAG: hypothetical protein LBU68_02945, partial [Rickettsiales bacterium]|nr:hypothetical protein [Rickettsiales bacterium]